MSFGDFAPVNQWIQPNAVVGLGNLRDFVPANNWVLPNQIVASPNGSLPKAPDLPKALVGSKNFKAAIAKAGGDCGCGGMCGGCGMGALTGDTIIPQASLPAFLQGDTWVTGFPNVYVAAGGLLLAVMFMGGGSSYGRRRRNPTRRRSVRRRGRR